MKTTALLVACSLLAGCAMWQAPTPTFLWLGARPDAVKEVRGGFIFTEGPVGDADGALLFADFRQNRVYRLAADGTLSVQREDSRGANGLAFERDGVLLTAERDSKLITEARPGDTAPLTRVSDINGKPMLMPNDLIADDRGGFYFTDPGGRPVPPGRIASIYYLPPGKAEPVLVDDTLPRPNGITLLNDGRTLIVDDTIRHEIYSYPVQGDGTVGKRQVYAHLHGIPANGQSKADGLAIDARDRLFVTSLTGVQVFERGRYLGTIPVPQQPANLAFAGREKKTLFITARTSIYAIRMRVPGPARLGK